MSSFDRAALAEEGFVGFLTFEDLRASLDSVPNGGGVYVVVRERLDMPTFLEVSQGGWFRGRDPAVEISRLQANWLDGCQTLYIGKGDDLRRRLRQKADFGAGKPVGAWGGRLIWQLGDADQLLVAWKSCGPDEIPAIMEARMVERFKAEHEGRLPFANIADPAG